MTIISSKKAIAGLTWTTAEYIIISVLQVLQLSILARILTPKDFGIYAIGTFFSTLGNTVFALGMGPALIQKKEDISKYLDTAWFSNLIVSVFAYIIIIIILPFIIKSYFNSPEALLPSIVISSVIVISGFNNIAIVTYLKKIEMKLIFFYHVIPKVIGITSAIVASLILKNYWGLVIGIVVDFSIRMVISYLILPRMPKFKFNYKIFKELYIFSGWLQLKNIIKWLTSSVDVGIVGSVLNTSMLGFYNRAVMLARLPQTQVTKIVNVISFPLYSSIISNEKKLQNAIKANNDLVLFIITPVLFISLFYGTQSVKLILGIEWIYLTSAFQLLILAISIESYFISFTPLLRAFGYPKYEFFYQLIKIIIMVIVLYPLISFMGIDGAGLAILISVVFSAPYMFLKIRKLVNIELESWLPSLLVTGVSFLLLFLVTYLIPLENISNYVFIILVVSICIVYLAIMLLFYQIYKIGPINSVIRTIKIIKSK